jgi:PAS domain S-box-containing protein
MTDPDAGGGVDVPVEYPPPPQPYPRPTYQHLSETGLFDDFAAKHVAPGVVAFEPTHKLWSDGADKRRWVRLPPGTRIDTSDMDHWVFPVGTQFFKEFSLGGVLLETRLVERYGDGPEDYWMGAFVWTPDASDAVLAPDGQSNINGTMHDAPKQKDCGLCHRGDVGRVLGFSAIQLSRDTTPPAMPDLVAMGWLSDPPADPHGFPAPGDDETAAALGYLHANCGHCHNENGAAMARHADEPAPRRGRPRRRDLRRRAIDRREERHLLARRRDHPARRPGRARHERRARAHERPRLRRADASRGDGDRRPDRDRRDPALDPGPAGSLSTTASPWRTLRVTMCAVTARPPPPGPPCEWLARVDEALARGGPGEARAAIAALLVEIAGEQARLRERLEMLSAASFEGVLVHVDGVVLEANERVCELLGCTREDLVGAPRALHCVAPEDMAEVRQRVASRYEGAYVITGVRRDGSRFRAELQAKQGRVGDRPVRVLAIRDVTERERTHALLRESERRFRDLAEATFDIIVYSRDGIIVDVGGDVRGLMGVEREQMLGRSVLDFTAPSARPAVEHATTANTVGPYDAAATNAAGETIPVQIVAVTTTLDGQPVRVAGLRDLRPARALEVERRALEQRVERAQRLESLGVLAGGIAHDFNNLLTGVLGNAEYLRERLAAGPEREAAEAIVAAAQSAAGLTRQMLAYAGQRELRRDEPVDVGALVRELRALLDATLSKKAELELDIEPGSLARGDRTTLSQVLMNLLTNASDALGDRPGRISVRVRRVRDLDARWDAALGATVRPGSWVLVEVRDTGAGMDEATRGRVFEPFFSTKERGHGLGLAACLGIVAAHGGAVLVESELGRGSCFSVLLPASGDADRAAGPEASGVAHRPCRVLVVDDEAVVRAQLRRSLELRGYVVEEAVNGRAALAALTAPRADGPPDVAVLDMTMPDMDGAEVLVRVRAAGSRVPVVVSSGYLDVAVERRLPRGQFQGFLPKPYGATDLVNAIEAARAT